MPSFGREAGATWVPEAGTTSEVRLVPGARLMGVNTLKRSRRDLRCLVRARFTELSGGVNPK